MVEDGMSSPDRPVRFHVEGDAGVLPAEVATPASVVLNELLQNAIDHAFPDELDLQAAPGSVTVSLANDGEHLQATVVDDGVGIPEGFDLAEVTGLGLSIVRTLVTSELMGTISLRRGDGPADRPGTVVQVDIPVARPE
jgi:two-component sensor histidine kinase